MPANSTPASRSTSIPIGTPFAGFSLGDGGTKVRVISGAFAPSQMGGRDVYCQSRSMSTSISASNSNDAIDSRPTDLGETGDQRSTDLDPSAEL
jgi:hypothetical protein